MRILPVETGIQSIKLKSQLKGNSMKKRKSIVAISKDGKYTVEAMFDKNDQLCDIQPRVPGTFVEGRFQSVTQDTLNTYRGQPYDICHDEVLVNLKWIADNEQYDETSLEAAYAESSEQSTEEE